jgi:hypothetical protein
MIAVVRQMRIVRVTIKGELKHAHPGQLKAEMNSFGADAIDEGGKPLKDKIEDLLFDTPASQRSATHV